MKAQLVIAIIIVILVIDFILVAMLFYQRRSTQEQESLHKAVGSSPISTTNPPSLLNNGLLNNYLNGTVESVSTIPGTDDIRIKLTNDDFRDGIYFRIVKDASNEQLATKAQTSLGYWTSVTNHDDTVQSDQLEFIGTAGMQIASSFIDNLSAKPYVHVKYRTCVLRTMDGCNIDSEQSVYTLGVYVKNEK